MKVVVLNNDFRAYWKGRLIFLRSFLATHHIDLYAIELFGKGSPYNFDDYNNAEQWWNCLFPSKSATELDKEQIKAALFKALDAIDADVVIGPSIVFFAGALGLQWAKKNKCRFIMFDDARPAQVKRNFIVQWVKDLITAQADALWLPSAHYADDYHMFKKHVHFFYGFSTIDNSLFNSATIYQPDHKEIICVARLVPIKNIDNLLRAWQLVEQQDNTVNLNIIGDGPEYQALLTLAKELKLTKVVFSGIVANSQLSGHYHQAVAFILPSWSETWGLVVNEAMAAGLPVLLSSGVNAARNLLQDGVNGYAFSPADINEISEVILRFSSLTDSQRVEMSVASLRLIDDMSYQHMGEQLIIALKHISQSIYKKPMLIAQLIINAWHGRYNTSGWDKL